MTRPTSAPVAAGADRGIYKPADVNAVGYRTAGRFGTPVAAGANRGIYKPADVNAVGYKIQPAGGSGGGYNVKK